MTMLTLPPMRWTVLPTPCEAHSGQAYGARDDSQLLAVWHAACRQSGMVALAFAALVCLAGEQIIALLTSLPSLQQLADRYLVWQMILPVIGVWCYLLDGMFIGATRGADAQQHGGGGGFALTLLTVPLGNHGLWLALTVFRSARRFSGGYLAAPLAARNLVFVMHLVHLMVKDSE
jgi:MATE family multidrug resistance protein